MTNEIQKWADVAMFEAEPIDVEAGPQVQLLSCNSDPLGTIAAAALMYEGKSVQSLANITDDQRRYYLEQTRKTALAAPLEFVNFHFIISGVTRGFTHQMVRQRTATYTQESTRFAVKEDVPVGRPPSLDGTIPWSQWLSKCELDLFPLGANHPLVTSSRRNYKQMIEEYAQKQASKEQLWRREWDECVTEIDSTYNALVSAGMPAEDARGLLPTNLLTRINYNSSLRGLLEHSGVRLCTQAQFEWRLVWTKMKEAMVRYGQTQLYDCTQQGQGIYSDKTYVARRKPSDWQFEELSTIFKPICYQKGSCQFNADVDRACSIKKRVEANAAMGRPSTKWNGDYLGTFSEHDKIQPSIGRIDDKEWMLDPSAARVSQ